MRHSNTLILKRIAFVTTISYVFFGCHALADSPQTNSSISNDNLMNILKPYYPLYNEKFECHEVISGSHTSDNGQKDEYGYCVKIDRKIMVEADKGKRLYVMVTGDLEFDGNGEARLKGHALSGLAGMFVLKPDSNHWQVESASPDISAGASGYALHDWKLVKLAPNKWGFLNEHSDLHQGYFDSGLIILTPIGNSIVESFINSHFSDAGTGRCGDVELPPCESIDAKLHSVDNSKVIDGHYPLKLIVNGNVDGKTYDNVIFTSYFDEKKGYQMPDNYPLKKEWE